MQGTQPSGNDTLWRWIERLQANEESRRSARNVAHSGCVPTPPAIARRMAERLWSGWKGEGVARLLDAGCGTAGLLTAAVRAAGRHGVRVEATGVDEDAAAVEWASGLSHLVRRAAGERLIRWDIQHADYLRSRSQRRYDLIVANPPYVSLRSVPAAQRRALQRRFGSGRGDLAMLFLHRMLEQLEPNGRLVAIVPNKLLAAHYGAALRHRILTGFHLREVHDLSEGRTFPGVGAYPVILVVDRRRPGRSISLRGAAGEERGRVERRVLASLPGSLLPLGLPPELVRMYSRLRRQGSFGQQVRIQCGIATSGFGRSVGSGRQRILLSGDIGPFEVRRRRRFDPGRAGIPVERLHRQRVEKIVLPGMFQELCAARARSSDLLGRVYFIPLQEASGEATRQRSAMLLALLNARVLRVLYRGLFQAVAQAGGWLRLNGPYLAALPWPSVSCPPELVRLITRAEAGDVSGIQTALDDHVEALFGVQPSEVALLEACLQEQRWKVQTAGPGASRRKPAAVPPEVQATS
jgi:SAM-dependent methyltransferase